MNDDPACAACPIYPSPISECPEDVCIQERPGGRRAYETRREYQKIWALADAGLPPLSIAAQLSISYRRVYRALETRKAAQSVI